ncbi:MAG: hypothetical protein ACJZ19_01205 [Candidatus Neomarinimicrobiota bacterium]|tara:strand:- start:476 stop:919 length:444 start_codon:yes stop_codon:yes gene_type:complete
MKKYMVFILLFSFQLLHSEERSEILFAMEKYNEAFILADYDQIIDNFIFPVSIITSDRMLSIDTKLGLRFVYKRIRGDLPEYYSYSKWNKIDIQVIDKNIAIVKASFSRYDKNEKKFYDGNGIYQLKKSDDKWKIFSLIPFQSVEIL